MLTAAVVCPGLREVFVVNNEPIVKQDGEEKNDCERNAAKRLFDRLSDTFSDQPVVYVLDALYACAPVIKQIVDQGPHAKYVINAKEKGNKYLFAQFDATNEAGQIKWIKKRVKDGVYHFGYANGLSINKANEGVKCNFLYCRYKPKNGKEIVFKTSPLSLGEGPGERSQETERKTSPLSRRRGAGGEGARRNTSQATSPLPPGEGPGVGENVVRASPPNT